MTIQRDWKRVSHKDWCEALDELTTYLKKRLKGRTKWGAHSERVLETPALDYYTEEAVAKILEGRWKWQDRYTLGEQLIEIAGSLITKNAEKYAREHPWVAAHTESTENHALGGYFKPEPKFIEVMDPDDLPDCIDPSTGSGTEEEMLDETYEMVQVTTLYHEGGPKFPNGTDLRDVFAENIVNLVMKCLE